MTLTARQVGDAAAIAGRLIVCLRHAHDAPGVAYGLSHEGRTVLLGADGVANLETRAPIDARTTRFRCASITKTFTATMVLRQVERKRLRLDDPVVDWLAWTKRTLDPALTIRHLLAHGGSVIRDGSNAWDDRTMPDRATLRAELEGEATFGAPWERFRYSNIAYALVGEVLEAATGTTFARLLHREIARPLGLRATDADLTPAAQRALATGYYASWPGEPRRPAAHVAARAIAPAGGLVSTVEDLLAYQQAHLPGDDRLLSELSKREMQLALWHRDVGPDYGLGWMTWHEGDLALVGHSGGYPGFTTQIAFSPEDRLCAAVLTNVVSPLASLGRQRIYETLATVAELWPAASTPTKWHTRASLAALGGIYRDNFGTLVVGRVNHALMVVPTDDHTPVARAGLLVASGPRRFRMARGDDFGFLGEELHFLANRGHKATTLMYGPHPYVRTEL